MIAEMKNSIPARKYSIAVIFPEFFMIHPLKIYFVDYPGRNIHIDTGLNGSGDNKSFESP
jgi:hypothetical protein